MVDFFQKREGQSSEEAQVYDIDADVPEKDIVWVEREMDFLLRYFRRTFLNDSNNMKKPSKATVWWRKSC